MAAAELLSSVPKHWESLLRPFLQRAAEFEGRQPSVAYFLKTHVAYVCMKNRTKEDKEGTSFLMKLLSQLEANKASNPELASGDGRTVLTKAALMLFARADDQERSGTVSEGVVKMFFASSILLEATGQYLEGQLDPIAAEKRKYARFVALKMKKALDSSAPYVSLNEREDGGGEGGDDGSVPPMGAPPAAAASSACGGGGGGFSYLPPQAQPSAAAQQQPPPQAFYAPPPPQPAQSGGYTPPQQQQAPPAPTTTGGGRAQPPAASPAAPPPATYYNPQPAPALQPQPVAPAPQQQQQQQQQQQYVQPPPPLAPAPAGFVPSQDTMIDAQKFAKQAVSALQFYDHANAKKQLLAAMALLEGRPV